MPISPCISVPEPAFRAIIFSFENNIFKREYSGRRPAYKGKRLCCLFRYKIESPRERGLFNWRTGQGTWELRDHLRGEPGTKGRISAGTESRNTQPGSRTAEGGPPNQDPGNRAALKGGRRTGELPEERAAATAPLRNRRNAELPLAAHRGKPRRGRGQNPAGRTAHRDQLDRNRREHLDYTADAL